MYLARLFPCFFFSVRDDARLSEEHVRSFRYRLDERQPRRSVSPRVTIHALYTIRWKRDSSILANYALSRFPRTAISTKTDRETRQKTGKLRKARRISRQSEIKRRFPCVARRSL